ncbi:MAG: M14-type cytosolic carboxypeptidase [Pseudomonas sp.]
MAIAVTGEIPCGSIQILDANDPGDIRLALRADAGTHFIGYYHFRVSGARGVACRFVITNVSEDQRLAGREQYEDEWTNTGPHASYDLESWFRIPASRTPEGYVFEHVPEHDVVYYAKWAPYTLEREQRFLARIGQSPLVHTRVLGSSVRGYPIECLSLGAGTGSGKPVAWIISRQHPSETMSGFFLEGFLSRLVDSHDTVASALRERLDIHVVPNMNPDGVAAGNTRANAVGINLNREWADPDPHRSPEVLCVRDEMERLGVDFCLDCHGDEELRCVFLGGPLEIPSRSEQLAGKFREFERAWADATPEYEMGHPYPGGAPETADLRMAWNWIGERFKCLSVLLEQPFKDTSWREDPVTGWSPQRAHALGDRLVEALYAMSGKLR